MYIHLIYKFRKSKVTVWQRDSVQALLEVRNYGLGLRKLRFFAQEVVYQIP